MARRQLPDLQPAIHRLKAIAADAGDRLLLADGPPNPDAELLDLCAEALHSLVAARKAYETYQTSPSDDRDRASWDDYSQHKGRAASFMTRAKKRRAITAGGIYAKALCVRASATGAAEFAMSLAEDLVNNPTLRAALCVADQAAPVPGGPDHAAA